MLKDHKPATYCSIGETRAALDWANRLMLRYGGCTGAYSNECFAFDVGTATWFPIRAADHYCDLFAEVRPNPGCSRGMTYDGNQQAGLDRPGHRLLHRADLRQPQPPQRPGRLRRRPRPLLSLRNAAKMAVAYTGEPSKAFAFDYDGDLVVGSLSGHLGISLVDAATRKTFVAKAPAEMPSWDQYRPPAFAYDPISRKILCTHPDLDWKLLSYDRTQNKFDIANDPYPGKPSKQIMGGLVYDSLNREMILIGGQSKETGMMPTCRYDRKTGAWVDLQAQQPRQHGRGPGHLRLRPGAQRHSGTDPRRRVSLQRGAGGNEGVLRRRHWEAEIKMQLFTKVRNRCDEALLLE